MPSITSDDLYAVAKLLDLEVDRFEETRPTDAASIGNGNWLTRTPTDERLVVRRYHVLSTEAGLGFEFAVLRHLAERGWSVPAPLAGPVSFGGRFWAVTSFIPGEPHAVENAAQGGDEGACCWGQLAGVAADRRTW